MLTDGPMIFRCIGTLPKYLFGKQTWILDLTLFNGIRLNP